MSKTKNKIRSYLLVALIWLMALALAYIVWLKFKVFYGP
jgi:hypothetical protein